jgi:NADPH:quinone reductase-like Zn-dependent oxidoreductase
VRVVRWHRFGEPRDVLQVEETASPRPGPGEVHVRLTARAIHPSDLQNVRGLYGRPPALPAVPGNDAAGVVLEVGAGVSGWAPGDRAILLLGATGGHGTWVDEVAVPAERLVKTPPVLSDAQAGALWVNYLSVWVMLEEVLRLQRGEVLVQTAAGSQLGLAVMEHAAWKGLLLISVVRRAEQAEELRAAGQPHVAVFPGEDLVRAVRTATGGRGATAAIDAVGGATGSQVLETLATGGTALLFGALDGGRPVTVAPGQFFFRGLTLQGFWLTRWLQTAPADRVRQAVAAVLQGVAEGHYRPAVDRSYPLHEVQAAVERAETPGRRGAVVLGAP